MSIVLPFDVSLTRENLAEDVAFYWYVLCTTHSSRATTTTQEQCFWWSLRHELNEDRHVLWARDPAAALARWADYFTYVYSFDFRKEPT